MSALDQWSAAACGALGLDEGEVAAQGVVLELAREVAHGVVRPAAPVSAYLLGLAVGRGADPAEAAATLTALARDWGAEESVPRQQGSPPAGGPGYGGAQGTGKGERRAAG